MTPIGTMTKDRLEWIIDGLDFEKLDDWEENFAEGCETYFKEHGYLKEGQEPILERIYRQKGR